MWPVLVVVAVIADKLEDSATTGADWNWNLALVPAPALLLGGFAVLFVLGLGLKALLSIVKYKVEGPASDMALAQLAANAPVGR